MNQANVLLIAKINRSDTGKDVDDDDDGNSNLSYNSIIICILSDVFILVGSVS
jgi:hypothetical protein